jgi:hypothetical protein
VKLVLQCATCGIHHPVGTPVCSTCRASGVTQLRLMFECQTCRNLGITLVCAVCAAPNDTTATQIPEEDLIIAEEVTDEPFELVEEDDFSLDYVEDEDEADESVIVDLSDEEDEEENDEDEEEDEGDSDLDLDDDLDSDLEEDDLDDSDLDDELDDDFDDDFDSDPDDSEFEDDDSDLDDD